MSDKREIPKHWDIKKLGEVCKLKNGFAFKSTAYKPSGIPVIRISDINDGLVSGEEAVRVDPNIEYENYLVENNDILVAMSGATTGKFGIYKGTERAYQNQRVGKFKILDERILNNQFLFHQINSLKRQIEKDAYGGAQPNISSAKIEQMEIVVPPLPEQQSIVSKIEELLSDLENGKQQLLTAQQQLKVYRQSLLKWAFEGKLTENWRKQNLQPTENSSAKTTKNGTKGKATLKVHGSRVRIPTESQSIAAEPEVGYKASANSIDGELPEGWKWVKLKEIASDISDGDHQAPPKAENGVPFITISNVNKQSNRIDFTETFKVYPDYYRNLKSNRRPQKGDVLYTVTGSFGIPILVDFEKEFCFQRHIGLIRPLEIINQKWVYYLLQSPMVVSQAKDVATGTAQKTVALNSLRNFNIPLCTLQEQQAIVEELENKLTVCDKIEEAITYGLQQVETLRQSILKRAFEGKLI